MLDDGEALTYPRLFRMNRRPYDFEMGDEAPELAPFNPVPFWCPRFWHGMEIRDWAKLISEHRYRIDRWPTAISISLATAAATIINPLQRWVYHEKCADKPLVEDPVFVIGHWRSGTTLVQELMTLDERYVCPNTFQCFAPNGFLLAEWWLKPLTWPLLPRRRPMDNMRMSWNAPMEDEFALMTMGLPTTYRRVAFPNDVPRHLDYLNMEGIPTPELERWKSGLNDFVDYLNYHYADRRLLFKSPPHTGRIRVLLDMYPNARFIHITRNPMKFIPSTIHMWAALDHSNALQTPHNRNLRQFVFDSYKRLYDGFHRDRHLLGDHNFVELRFEDLVGDYAGAMRQVYDQLGIDGFDEYALKPLQAEKEKSRSYKGNQHGLPKDLSDEILEKCGDYIDHFGYSREVVAA